MISAIQDALIYTNLTGIFGLSTVHTHFDLLKLPKRFSSFFSLSLYYIYEKTLAIAHSFGIFLASAPARARTHARVHTGLYVNVYIQCVYVHIVVLMRITHQIISSLIFFLRYLSLYDVYMVLQKKTDRRQRHDCSLRRFLPEKYENNYIIGGNYPTVKEKNP